MIMAKATATNRYPVLPVFRVTSLALFFVVKQDSTGLYGDVILGFLALSTPCRHKTKNKRLFMHLLPLYYNKQKSESITRNRSLLQVAGMWKCIAFQVHPCPAISFATSSPLYFTGHLDS